MESISNLEYSIRQFVGEMLRQEGVQSNSDVDLFDIIDEEEFKRIIDSYTEGKNTMEVTDEFTREVEEANDMLPVESQVGDMEREIGFHVCNDCNVETICRHEILALYVRNCKWSENELKN